MLMIITIFITIIIIITFMDKIYTFIPDMFVYNTSIAAVLPLQFVYM
jgi:hypothetical protein